MVSTLAPQPEEGHGGPVTGRIITPEQKLALLQALEHRTGPVREFCQEHHITPVSLYKWKRQYGAYGEQGLQPRFTKSLSQAYSQTHYRLDQRKQACEAFLKSGMTLDAFSQVWGIARGTLRQWIIAYEAHGADGLERPYQGERRKPRTSRLSIGLQQAVIAAKDQFPQFGFKRLGHFLKRFRALKVSAGSIQKILYRSGRFSPSPAPARPRKRHLPRRFERSRPNALWQSDFTSFVLHRVGQRVHLVVFMDDFSRYIVSWGLFSNATAAALIETYQEGVSRFGKPLEVLTDQGRQYFAWRGHSKFEKLLKKQGIKHVVARSHHPQTLGKCERFWKTVDEEFWCRVEPRDLTDARERLAHFFAYYNHFRQHQGIDNMIPADRYFEAESEVRKSIQKAITDNELRLAINEEPRKPVYLVGQIGEQQVSLHGEKGKMILLTPDGERREIACEEVHIQSQNQQPKEDQNGRETNTRETAERPAAPDGNGQPQAPAQGPQETPPVQDPSEISLSSQSPVECGDRRGETAGAPDRSGPPASVAGPDFPGGSSPTAGNIPPADMAAVPAGCFRDALGSVDPAQDSQGSHSPDGLQLSQGHGEETAGNGGPVENPAGAH